MKKEKGEWTIESEEESNKLLDAVLPGFKQAVETISKSFENMN